MYTYVCMHMYMYIYIYIYTYIYTHMYTCTCRVRSAFSPVSLTNSSLFTSCYYFFICIRFSIHIIIIRRSRRSAWPSRRGSRRRCGRTPFLHLSCFNWTNYVLSLLNCSFDIDSWLICLYFLFVIVSGAGEDLFLVLFSLLYYMCIYIYIYIIIIISYALFIYVYIYIYTYVHISLFLCCLLGARVDLRVLGVLRAVRLAGLLCTRL